MDYQETLTKVFSESVYSESGTIGEARAFRAGFAIGYMNQAERVLAAETQLMNCIAFLHRIGIDPKKVEVDGIDMHYFEH